MPRTPLSQWGALFNFAGAGIVHQELFDLLTIMAQGPTWLELIAEHLLQWGTIAARPTATEVPDNAYYFATDTSVLYQSRSGSWAIMSPNGTAADPPRCAARRDAAQSIPNTTITPIEWDNELYDDGDMIDLGTDDTRITFPVAGIYLVQASLTYDSNATGYRSIWIALNNSTHMGQNQIPAVNGASTRPTCGALVKANAAEYVTLRTQQTSGGSLNTGSTSTTTTQIQACWIAPSP